ncbi:hypothetical protein RND81_04G152000 [Saponaria officinalis]|uniref:Pentatricopeptide repeat-containing protein n=1 Tax=Saponaria officinalis TaxID=3572 RepID=A0AAW1LMC7_SAPOF
MPPLPKDIPKYASLLQLCCTTKNLQKLHQIHAQTIKLSISYNDFTRSKLISAYTSCSQISDAHFIFSLCNRQSTFLYNTLIRGYSSIKKFDLSLDIFRQMIFFRKEIDSNTLPAVLKSVAAVSGLRVGKRVHGYALVRGFGSDLAHCNALINVYGKSGDMVYARKVFDEMPEQNLITWCAMMSVYGMHGQFDEVFGLFDELLIRGVELDAVVFTTVLTACSHGGRVETGKEYFKMMTDVFKLKPSMEHYTCMVDMLGRSGRIEEAKDLIEKMKIEPDEALWRAFLGACKFHRESEIIVRGRYYYV